MLIVLKKHYDHPILRLIAECKVLQRAMCYNRDNIINYIKSQKVYITGRQGLCPMLISPSRQDIQIIMMALKED